MRGKNRSASVSRIPTSTKLVSSRFWIRHRLGWTNSDRSTATPAVGAVMAPGLGPFVPVTVAEKVRGLDWYWIFPFRTERLQLTVASLAMILSYSLRMTSVLPIGDNRLRGTSERECSLQRLP